MDNENKAEQLKELIVSEGTEYQEGLKALQDMVGELVQTRKQELEKTYPRYIWFVKDYLSEWFIGFMEQSSLVKEKSRTLIIAQEYLEQLEEELSQVKTEEETFDEEQTEEIEQEQTEEIEQEQLVDPEDKEQEQMEVDEEKESIEDSEEQQESEEIDENEEKEDVSELVEKTNTTPLKDSETEEKINTSPSVQKKTKKINVSKGKFGMPKKEKKPKEVSFDETADFEKQVKKTEKEVNDTSHTTRRQLTPQEIKERNEKYGVGVN